MTSDADHSGPRLTHLPWVRVVACAAGVLLAYYAVPVRWTGDRLVPSLLLTLVGVVLLAWAITGLVRRQLGGIRRVDLPSLVTLLTLVLAVFSLGYYALETARPEQFSDLATRTDALYFTLQVLTTVGLGDINPEGQVARGLVALQMVFDLVFVAAAGSLLMGLLRERASGRT